MGENERYNSGASRCGDGQSLAIIGFVFAVSGTALAILALFLDQITDIDSDGSDPYIVANFEHCGFQSFWISSESGYGSLYYSYFCEDPDGSYTNEQSEEFCEASVGATFWLILGMFAVLCGLSTIQVSIAAALTHSGRRKYAKYFDVLATIFAIGAIISFYANNDACWDEDAVEDEIFLWGASSYCMTFAAFSWLVASIIGFVECLGAKPP